MFYPLSRLLAELPILAAEKNDVLLVAGVLWMAAFVLFLAAYGCMLLRRDGAGDAQDAVVAAGGEGEEFLVGGR